MAINEVHNRLVPNIIMGIVQGVKTAGGTSGDVMVFLESIVAGTLIKIIRTGGDDSVVDIFAENLKRRMKRMRSSAAIVEAAKADEEG